jgi:hypothetical protein
MDVGGGRAVVRPCRAEGYVVKPPRLNTARVRVEDGGRKQRVTEVLEIDTSSARPGENESTLRKPKT